MKFLINYFKVQKSDAKYKLLNLDFHDREIYSSIRFSVLIKKCLPNNCLKLMKN